MLSSSWYFGASQADVLTLRAALRDTTDENDQKSMQLVLYENDLPVAGGSLFFDSGTYHIAHVGVLPEMRKRGIGDLAVRMLLMRAFGMMAERVRCRVSPENAGFFARYGFRAAENDEWEVTPATLTFLSKCGHDCSSCALQNSCHGSSDT